MSTVVAMSSLDSVKPPACNDGPAADVTDEGMDCLLGLRAASTPLRSLETICCGGPLAAPGRGDPLRVCNLPEQGYQISCISGGVWIRL